MTGLAENSIDGLSRAIARRRQNLSDNVYELVKALVMDRAIAPGTRVNIDALARQLEVSQTPLREALARLESDSLVVKEPLRGYSTTPLLSRSELDDLYQLRLLIEPWAAAQAARDITSEGKSRLRAEMAECTQAPAGGEYETFKLLASHDNRFHDLVMELSGNETVRRALERTHCHLHIFRLYYGSTIGTKALNEHQRIVRAIAAGHPDRAFEAMTLHLEASAERLRSAAI